MVETTDGDGLIDKIVDCYNHRTYQGQAVDRKYCLLYDPTTVYGCMCLHADQFERVMTPTSDGPRYRCNRQP